MAENIKEKLEELDSLEHVFVCLLEVPKSEHTLRFSAYASTLEDLDAFVKEHIDPNAQVILGVSAAQLLSAQLKSEGKEGFLISNDSGLELFIEGSDEEQAKAVFENQTGSAAASWCSSQLLSALLQELEEDIANKQVIVNLKEGKVL